MNKYDSYERWVFFISVVLIVGGLAAIITGKDSGYLVVLGFYSYLLVRVDNLERRVRVAEFFEQMKDEDDAATYGLTTKE